MNVAVRRDAPLRPLPTGPLAWFSVYRALAADPLDTLFRFAVRSDRSLLNIGTRRMLLVSHPDDIAQVLLHQHRRFHKGRAMRLMRRVLGDGLLTSEDEFWLRQRRLAQPAFHRQRVARYGDAMVDITERMLSQWSDQEVRDVARDMTALALTVAGACLFSMEVGDRADQIRSSLMSAMRYGNRTIKALMTPPAWMPSPGRSRFERAADTLDRVVYDIIDRRRSAVAQSPTGEGDEDLLGLLMAARDDEGRPMTDRQLRDESMTLLLAGHETSANALAWTFYLLDQNPAARDRLERELDETLAGAAPSADRLARLPYLGAVVSEALRLYPPVWLLVRESVAPFTLGRDEYPAGLQVLASPYVVHHDGRWFDAPEAFLPERWLDGRTDKLRPFAYLPFGGGPRLCIGRPFALLEVSLVLATVLSRWRITRPAGGPVAADPLISLRPRGGPNGRDGLLMVAQRRDPHPRD
jgi:cytochrome P450